MAVHRRLCYPHVTSAAVVYGGRGYWTNGHTQFVHLTMVQILITQNEFLFVEQSYLKNFSHSFLIAFSFNFLSFTIAFIIIYTI